MAAQSDKISGLMCLIRTGEASILSHLIDLNKTKVFFKCCFPHIYTVHACVKDIEAV